MIMIRDRRDGEIDDTARIQEAIDRAALTGSDIYLAGDYSLITPLTLYGVSHIVGGQRNEG